ncbi:MAG TPA: hypothetical protein VM327_10150 [Candidatus Thermoplasmatota archaeon]|nr:hypothetical protein [Candidatus Thermoplasmatota archaeon]
MARRKDSGAQVTETVFEEQSVAGGTETHVHRTIREWHPHAAERLSEIEAIIDSWGRRVGDAPVARHYGHDELAQRVDKLTRKVKGSRRVVVQETVTDWVERPVEAEPESTYTPVEPVEDTVKVSRPKPSKRSFRALGFLGKRSPKADKPAKAKRDTSDADYQPQCAALTEDGQQCRNSARGVSRYCSSHKGYQPPTAKGLAQRIEGDAWDPRDDLTDRQSVRDADTRPVVRKAKDTKVKVRKATKKSSKKAARRKRR